MATAVAHAPDPELTWRWTPTNLLVAAGGTAGACGVAVAILTLPAIGLPLLALLVVGLAGLGVLAIASSRFEDYLVLLLVTRPAIDNLQVGAGPLSPTSAVGAMSVALGLAWLWQRQRHGQLVQLSRFTLALIGLSVVAFVNPLFAFGRVEAFESAVKLLSFAVLMAVLEQLFRTAPESRRRMLRAVLWSLVVPATMAFIQLLTSRGTAAYIEVGRVQGTFSHPNPFGTYLAMVIAIGLVLCLTAPRRTRGVLLATVGIAAVVLLFTYSRGAWTAAIVGVVVIALRLNRRILRYMLVAGILVVVAVPSVATRLGDLSGDHEAVANEDPNSLAWRVGYWEDIFSLGVDSPVGGIGLDSTQLVRSEGLAPHNVFVQSFVELGVPGFAALLIALVACVNQVHRADYWARDEWERALAAGAAAVGVGFFLQMFSENLLTQPVSLWYFAVVIAAALANGWVDGVSPTTIRGELSLRQRLSLLLEQRRRPEQAAIEELEGADLGARIKGILERNARRQDSASSTPPGGSSGE